MSGEARRRLARRPPGRIQYPEGRSPLRPSAGSGKWGRSSLTIGLMVAPEADAPSANRCTNDRGTTEPRCRDDRVATQSRPVLTRHEDLGFARPSTSAVTAS